MIPRKSDRILVQGITGKQGTFWTEKMIEYGASVVGGVHPKKAGTEHLGVPVMATAKEAEGTFDIAVMFIPPMAAKAAAIDACEAGAKLLVCLTEHIPAHDVMEMHAAARASGTRIVGPNTAGIVVPGETFVGILPAFNTRVFQPGGIGVISRSGSLGTLISLNLVQNGLGQSVVHEETGLLVPPEDVSALGEALVRIVGDAALRLRLGAGGPRCIEEQFLADRNVERYVQLFEEVLAER